jgi:polyhydroxyalkanoate synthase
MQPGPHPLQQFLALAGAVTQGDLLRLRRVMAGLARYQKAARPPPPPRGAVLARRGDVALRHLAGPADGPAVLLLPSIINGPEVLFLPGASLADHLAAQGLRVLLIDWGDLARERRLGLSGLVSARLLPLLEAAGPCALLGYCLGGTLAMALAVRAPRLVTRLALLATPLDFAGYPAATRAGALRAWGALAPLATALGGLPVTLLNPLFWSLDQEAVIAKFARLADLPEADPALDRFVAIEDWAGSGPPLPLPAARDLFVQGFGRNRIGRGLWRVGGMPVHADAIGCPVLEVGASRDRLVPPAARPAIGTRLTLDAGHVGMITGGGRHALLGPLSNFLCRG